MRRPVGPALALLASSCGLDTEWTAEVEPVDMGVDVRLEAVTWDFQREHLFAVGSGGVVVDDLGHQWELPGTLRDVITTYGTSDRLIVVGDHGFVAIAEIVDEVVSEFEVLDVGTQSDLHAVAGDCVYGPGCIVLIVGDDTLIMGSEDEQGELVWTHPQAPADGWGKLRDVGSPDASPGSILGERLCAVGDAGRMVCAHEVALDEWVWEVVPLGTDANLTSICAAGGLTNAVGEDGTVLFDDGAGGWSVEQLHPPVDFVACTSFFYYPVLVGADRTIYTNSFDDELDPLVTLDWEPRGGDPLFGGAIVGDGGNAGIFHITGGLILQ